ncbi:TRAP-type mannitol/chloroaromatic compound transport system permease small subunit [Bacillus pakistanensis]|uniref:TRAP-type mannitol/chloroaromatic compound transport system permease small subunit n=1 Tax=Rossellomorea pakistanensis TaxID=992288 RepID=A0ABS2NHC1_9BACI|nr:TRAP transporter small permease subunit [Bacillus pakistanensis]MBM7587256.1 TRAP-type mannitol/chloroaromatic compound transport system permease small subunit [Bacillus pakistanensis]
MKPIMRGIEALSSAAGKLAGYLMIPLTLVIVYTIVMRRFFSNAPDWGFEVPIFIFGISILLAGADVLRMKGHIAVDIINARLPDRLNRLLSTFALLLILVVCTFLVFKGTEMAIESTRILERSSHQSSFNPQIWWFKLFIPLSGLLVWFQAWVEVYKVWRGGEK